MTLDEWLGPPRQDAKGIVMPFVSRAAKLANPPLPLPAGLHSPRRDELLARDAEVAQLFATKGAAAALPAFRDNPLGGCTTLLDMARREIGFDPTQATVEDPRVLAYFDRLTQCPLFKADIQPQRWDTSRYPPAFFSSRLADLLEQDVLARLTADAHAAVGGRLRDILARQGNAEIHIDPLYYSGITEQGGRLIVEIVLVALAWRQLNPIFVISGLSFMHSIFAKAYFVQLSFRDDLWSEVAEAVSARHYQSVSDWLASN